MVEGVSGNAAKSGIKAGDTIIYASSFFGDELWPADKLSFTQTAIQRAPSPVAFVYVSSTNLCVNTVTALGCQYRGKSKGKSVWCASMGRGALDQYSGAASIRTQSSDMMLV